MSDNFTEVTRTSWGSRIKSALGGIFIGIILIIVGIFLLQWNEGRTIKTKRALNEGSGLVLEISAEEINSPFENKLIHISGMVQSDEVLQDPIFKIRENAIHLSRKVQMYQWIEKSESKTKDKVGGAQETTTTYTYSKEWKSSPVSSSSFKNPEGHQNPGVMPYDNITLTAKDVTVGAFNLSTTLINKISGSEPVSISQKDFSFIKGSELTGENLYIGKGSIQEPNVGDIMVSFSVIKPKMVSIVGKQSGNGITAYKTSNKKEILLLSNNNVGAQEMFTEALSSNKFSGWLLRAVGILALIIAFSLILKPLVVLADVIPFIGGIVGFGTGLVSFLLGLSIGFITIAIAWMAYRPLIAIPLLIVAAASLILIIVKGSSKKRVIHQDI